MNLNEIKTGFKKLITNHRAAEIFAKEFQKDFETMRTIYNSSVDCEPCAPCAPPEPCEPSSPYNIDCSGCKECHYCNHCFDCDYCDHCYNTDHSHSSGDCYNCKHVIACVDCRNCFFCYKLIDKENHILNKPATVEKINELKQLFNELSRVQKI